MAFLSLEMKRGTQRAREARVDYDGLPELKAVPDTGFGMGRAHIREELVSSMSRPARHFGLDLALVQKREFVQPHSPPTSQNVCP